MTDDYIARTQVRIPEGDFDLELIKAPDGRVNVYATNTQTRNQYGITSNPGKGLKDGFSVRLLWGDGRDYSEQDIEKNHQDTVKFLEIGTAKAIAEQLTESPAYRQAEAKLLGTDNPAFSGLNRLGARPPYKKADGPGKPPRPAVNMNAFEPIEVHPVTRVEPLMTNYSLSQGALTYSVRIVDGRTAGLLEIEKDRHVYTMYDANTILRDGQPLNAEQAANSPTKQDFEKGRDIVKRSIGITAYADPTELRRDHPMDNKVGYRKLPQAGPAVP